MAAEAGGDGGAGIGTRLRAARARKGLSILQAAERIHSDPRVVEALESENFASLGASVYARGHLRHYAEVLDEPVAELLELYAGASRTAPSNPDLTQIPRAQPENTSGRLVAPTVMVLVLLAIIGTVGWVVSLEGQRTQPATLPQVSTGHDGASPSQTAKAGDGAGAALPAGAPTSLGGANSSSQISGTAKGVPGQPNAPSGGTAGAAPAPAGPAPRPKEGELTLKFNADSWAEVYDASGQRLFYDVGAAASAHTVRGPAPLRVVLGNASGVALEFHGRPAAIPNGTLPDGSAQFLINAHGRAVPAKPAANGD